MNRITVPAEADEQRQQITTPRISAEIQAVVAEIDARRDVLRSEGAESETRGELTSAAFDVVRSLGRPADLRSAEVRRLWRQLP